MDQCFCVSFVSVDTNETHQLMVAHRLYRSAAVLFLLKGSFPSFRHQMHTQHEGLLQYNAVNSLFAAVYGLLIFFMFNHVFYFSCC